MRPTFAYAPGPFDQPPEHDEGRCPKCFGHFDLWGNCHCEPAPKPAPRARPETDRRCAYCATWLDKYGRCQQCREDADVDF